MTHECCWIFIWNTVKQGRSLTHMVSPDEIQNIRSKSECLPSECWKEENISSKAFRLVSVAVSKLGHSFIRSFICFFNNATDTDLVFVQPGAKNKQCLLLWERTRTRFTTGSSPYLEQRLRVQAGHCACTPFVQHCRLPAFQLCLSSLNQRTGRRRVQI